MKIYINKKFKLLEKKILNKFNTSKKSNLSIRILINYLIYLNLKTEKLLFKKNFNPEKLILKDIYYLHSLINYINFFQEFSNKELKKQKFILEKNHKTLFQKLWTNYTFNEFKKERLGRYSKRIKINKIENLIKNKKIVDFGCGHGNFLMSMLKFQPQECVVLITENVQLTMLTNLKENFLRKKKYLF